MPTEDVSAFSDREKVEPWLRPGKRLVSAEEALDRWSPEARSSWQSFRAAQGFDAQWTAVVDARSGLVEIAEGSGVPWIPGRGNTLTTADLAAHMRGRSAIDLDVLERLVRGFADGVAPLLGLEGRTLALNRDASGPYSDYLWFVEFDVIDDASGLEIDGARVFFRVNNGNLIQFGAERVPSAGVTAEIPRLSPAQAKQDLETYLGGLDAARDWWSKEGELVLLPVVPGRQLETEVRFGQGYALLPVWQMVLHRDGAAAVWRGRVDAVTGEVVEFRDTTAYAQVTGGYWPVSWRVGGVQQGQTSTGWPYTTVNPTGGTSNTSGIYTLGRHRPDRPTSGTLRHHQRQLRRGAGHSVQRRQRQHRLRHLRPGGPRRLHQWPGDQRQHPVGPAAVLAPQQDHGEGPCLPAGQHLAAGQFDRQRQHQQQLQRLLERRHGQLLHQRWGLQQHRRGRRYLHARVGPRYGLQRRQRRLGGERHRRDLRRLHRRFADP